MDRELIGVILVCLVGSSVPVMLFLGEKARSRITVLKVEYPERFSAGVPNRFALNILARKNVEDLVVQYCYLYRVTGPKMGQLYVTEGFNESVLSDSDPYRFLTVSSGMWSLANGLPANVGYETLKAKVPYTYTKEFEAEKVNLFVRFYDFSDMLAWVPSSAHPEVYGACSAFALVWLPEHGNISVFQGAADFYLNRDDSVSDIEFGKDGTSSLYLNPKIREIVGEFVHVNDGPPFGTVRFGSLRKGQMAYLSFTTRDITLPAIQVVRFWVNGELSEEDTQFILMGKPI